MELIMKKRIIVQLIFASLFIVNINAQNKLNENNVKSHLSKIFDFSKDQNFASAANLFIYNKNNALRAFNYSNKTEARAVKRMVKKIKAYLDLSDSYEYESITFGTFKNLHSAELKVNFKSGDQKLSISFMFVELSGKILLAKFR